MKCVGCGAEIGLTDKVCPHCGRKNTETAGYRSDMERLKKDSEKTKKKIGEILSENIPIVISAFCMLLLLIAVLMTIYVSENAYSFRENAKRKESVKQYDEYSAVIRKYLDAGDYTGFAAFKEYHNIAHWEEPYEDLNLICDMADYYSSMVSAVEEATMFGPEARRYDPESDISNCHRAIQRFYDEFDYRLSDIDSDPYRDNIYDMKAEADIIMEVYLGLDEEGRKSYFSESSIRQEAYLEEVLMND